LAAIFCNPNPLFVELRTNSRGAAIGLVKYAKEGDALVGEMLNRGTKLRGKVLKIRVTFVEPVAAAASEVQNLRPTTLPPHFGPGKKKGAERESGERPAKHPRVRLLDDVMSNDEDEEVEELMKEGPIIDF